MSLHIQNFLRQGGTLKELNQKYEIQYNISEELGVVVFNYRIVADMNDPIVRESRGLVLELDTWDVVCKSLDAFFRLSEPQHVQAFHDMDWSTAKAVEKLDGALLCLYYYKDAWRVSTRLSATGDWLVWSMNSMPHSISWAEYVKLTLQDMGTNWEEFTSKLNKDVYYTFEIVGPENRVVVVYTDRRLYLVGAVDKHTLKEIDIYSLAFPELKAPYREVRSLQEAWDIVFEEDQPYDHEGRIVLDANFNRLKLVSPAYNEAAQRHVINDDLSALVHLKDSIAILDTNQGGGPASIEFGVTLSKMTELMRFIQEDFFTRGFAEDSEIKAIWPEAYQALRRGESIAEAIDKMDNDSILKAVAQYNSYQQKQKQKQKK